MRPSIIIPRLREQCPIFANRVASAATLRGAIDRDDLPAPHAFVVLTSELADGEVQLSGLNQEVTLRFGVVVAVANTSDERGQAAVETLIDVKRQLLLALVGWCPDPERYSAILYRGMPDDPDTSRLRAWAQFDFSAQAFALDLI